LLLKRPRLLVVRTRAAGDNAKDVLLSTLLAEQEGHTSGQIRQLRATIRIALQDRIGMPNKPIYLA
jgi:hypothetical protein